MDILRENFSAFRNCWLVKSGTQTGVRETYRIVGMHEMKADDIIDPKPFADTFAKGTHVIDIHKPNSSEQDIIILEQEYNIPYGILVPINSENVIAAGRCVCADEAAFGSLRVMATCMAMGQAAGTAAVICVQKDCSMCRMNTDLLVKKLIEQGAIINFENC